MNTKQKSFVFSVYMIPIAVIVLCLLVWPCKLIGSSTYTSTSLEKGLFNTITLSEGSSLSGTFVPAKAKLKSLSFRFQTYGETPDGVIRLELFDDAGDPVGSSSLHAGDYLNGRWARFLFKGLRLDPNQTYTYRLSAERFGDNPPTVYMGSAIIGPAETRDCYYNGNPIGIIPAVTFSYLGKADLAHALPFYVCILCLGIVLFLACRFPGRKLLPWALCLAAAILLLYMTDESTTPVTVTAKNLTRSAGDQEDTAVMINSDSEYSGEFLKSGNYLLDKGVYTLGVAYNTDSAANSLTLYDNGARKGTYTLDPNATYDEFTFELGKTSQDFTYSLSFGGEGTLRIYSVTLIPEGRFYNDTFFLILCVMALFLAAALICSYYAKKGYPADRKYTLFLLLGIGLAASLPYLNTGLNWAVDLCYHLIRIEGIKDGLLAGQLPVVIYPEAMHGNGYLNCMYPNTLLYIPAFLRICGVSMADSFKFLMIVCNFATAFLTYHCARTLGGNRKAALLASLLYSCCPYRFTNLYARGAIGEFLAMTFFPLLFTGLYHVLIGDRKKWGYLALGMTGLLQTHILSVTLAGIFCVLFGLLYVRQVIAEKRLIEIAKAAVVSVLLNIGFLVPFVDFYKNENLWQSALDIGTYQEYTMNLSGLLGMQTTGDYHILTLGIPLAVCAFIALAVLICENRPQPAQTGADVSALSPDLSWNGTRSFILCLTVLGIVLLYMMTNFFPGSRMMELPVFSLILSKVQFAWRLLGPVSLLFALTGSICLYRSEILSAYRPAICVALAALCLLSVSRFRDEDFSYSDKSYTIGHEAKLTGIPKGANTVVYPYEWRLKNTLDSGLTTDIVLTDENAILIESFERQGTTTELSYIASAPGQYADLPIQYYMGYEAVDEKGEQIPLETGYNNKIHVLLNGDGNPHKITVYYHTPTRYTLSAWISILTAIGVAVWWIIRKFRYQRQV
ncbi:MAG: hypothetical protein MSH20_03435 [Lachnospiraceae bacterium]|nr:hypothetical protein [Lachnospiraceae bacterium]